MQAIGASGGMLPRKKYRSSEITRIASNMMKSKEEKQSHNTVFEDTITHYWPYLNIEVYLLSTTLF